MNSNYIKHDLMNRRSFIRSSGMVAVGGTALMNLGFATPLFGKQRETLKVGLIGCGGRGTGAANQALKADPNVELVAMGDVFKDRLEESYGNLIKIHPEKVKVKPENRFVGFDAYKNVIASGVDVVLLAAPPGFRPEHLEASVAAGKHVFCEKPMAVDAPGVRRVMEAVKESKTKNLSLVSGFTFRYDKRRRELFSRVLDGQLGQIDMITSTRNGGNLWYKERQPEWTDMEYKMRNWYYYNWLSGDFIVEMIVHSFDMMAWALRDQVPLRATGTGGRQARVDSKWGNIYDHFAVELEYANDVKAFNFCRQQTGTSSKNTVEIAGTKGKAFLGGNKTHITGETPWEFTGEDNDPYQTQHDELFDAIRKGTPINDGEFMANSTMLAILSRMVGYSGQTLTWEEALNSNQSIGPAPDAYHWDLVFNGPEVAIPGVTKVV